MNRKSINISDQNLETIKYRMKIILMEKYLPASPEDEEGRPLFHGLNSWVYRYYEFVEDDIAGANRLSFKAMVVLRKQFHELVEKNRFYFNVDCVYSDGKYEVNVLEVDS